MFGLCVLNLGLVARANQLHPLDALPLGGALDSQDSVDGVGLLDVSPPQPRPCCQRFFDGGLPAELLHVGPLSERQDASARGLIWHLPRLDLGIAAHVVEYLRPDVCPQTVDWLRQLPLFCPPYAAYIAILNFEVEPRQVAFLRHPGLLGRRQCGLLIPDPGTGGPDRGVHHVRRQPVQQVYRVEQVVHVAHGQVVSFDLLPVEDPVGQILEVGRAVAKDDVINFASVPNNTLGPVQNFILLALIRRDTVYVSRSHFRVVVVEAIFSLLEYLADTFLLHVPEMLLDHHSVELKPALVFLLVGIELPMLGVAITLATGGLVVVLQEGLSEVRGERLAFQRGHVGKLIPVFCYHVPQQARFKLDDVVQALAVPRFARGVEPDHLRVNLPRADLAGLELSVPQVNPLFLLLDLLDDPHAAHALVPCGAAGDGVQAGVFLACREVEDRGGGRGFGRVVPLRSLEVWFRLL